MHSPNVEHHEFVPSSTPSQQGRSAGVGALGARVGIAVGRLVGASEGAAVGLTDPPFQPTGRSQLVGFAKLSALIQPTNEVGSPGMAAHTDGIVPFVHPAHCGHTCR